MRRPESPEELTRKLLHSSRERARHRFVMRTLEKLAEKLPLNRIVYRSKTSQLKGTIEYCEFMEETIHSICARRQRCPPANCSLFTTNQSHRLAKAAWASTASRKEVLTPPETHLSSIDDAVVPDVDFLPQVCDIKQESADWEHYGISKEDWMAAGSSQQEATPHSSEQIVPTMPSKTYVNLVTDSVTSMPMKEAPEYFVVSAKGEVISLGKLLH